MLVIPVHILGAYNPFKISLCSLSSLQSRVASNHKNMASEIGPKVDMLLEIYCWASFAD